MKNNTCNHKDHELWNRRSFLQALGLASMSSMVMAKSNIAFATNTQLTAAINNADNENILLVVKLFGGNDGLNMIVPLNQYDIYANARPTIKVPENNLINLTDEYAIPDVMGSLEPMWREDKFKVVHSVGYENQTRSHFQGTDIWAAAEIENTEYDTGWLGRYYDSIYEDFVFDPPASPVAIEIGNIRNVTFDGEENKYNYSVASISSLQSIAETGRTYSLDNLPDCEYGNKVIFLRSTYNNSFNYAGKIHDAYQRSSDYTGGVGGYPDEQLGDSLNLIARLIKGNLGTKVYMVTLTGFDTHANQYGTQQGLLNTLSESIAYFHEDLTAAGWGDKIVTMAQSEFGRRVEENGSKGTGHGAAGPIMLFGEALEGSGFVGEHADLNDLNRGDLKHHTDFRQVYSSLLKNWMCADPNIVDTFVLGSEFESLDLGFQCNNDVLTTDETDVLNTKLFKIYATYTGDDSTIHINSNTTQHLTVTLYDLKGQEVAVLDNSVVFEGKKRISLNEKAPGLASGIYIYRVYSNSRVVSNKILVL